MISAAFRFAGVAALLVAGSALAQGAARNLGSKSKTLFWVASCTPCDKNLKFDPAAFKDVLGWFQHNGADGVVVCDPVRDDERLAGMGLNPLINRAGAAMKPMPRPPVGSYPFRVPPSLRGAPSQLPAMAM